MLVPDIIASVHDDNGASGVPVIDIETFRDYSVSGEP